MAARAASSIPKRASSAASSPTTKKSREGERSRSSSAEPPAVHEKKLHERAMERSPAEQGETQKRRKKSQEDTAIGACLEGGREREKMVVEVPIQETHRHSHSLAAEDEMEEEELELFQIVQEDLRLKSTVGWQNAVKSLNSALNHLERPESQLFLEFAFPRIVSIMLDQQYVVALEVLSVGSLWGCWCSDRRYKCAGINRRTDAAMSLSCLGAASGCVQLEQDRLV